MEDERSAGQRRRRLRLGAALVGCGLALLAALRTSDGAAPPNLSQAQEARHEASIGAIGYPSEDDGTVDASSDGVATVDATAAIAPHRGSTRSTVRAKRADTACSRERPCPLERERRGSRRR